MQYSVPYEYIKQKVDVRLTKNMVEVFYNQNRIASHRRLYGHPGQYSTVEAHMPEDHQKYLQWDGERFVRWAERIGPATAITIKGYPCLPQNPAAGLQKLHGSSKTGGQIFCCQTGKCCVKALQFTPQPSYKSIQNILVTGQDKLETAPAEKKPVNNEYGFTRGAKYYGRK